STMALTVAATTVPGTYALTVTGTSGTLSHTAPATLVVTPAPDFSLSSSPASQSAVAGTSASYTLTTAAVGGFNGQVALSVSGLPTGVTSTFTPTSIAGSGTSTMALTVAATTVPGTYALTVTGTSGTLSHTAPATLVVTPPPPGFVVTATPTTQSAPRGTTITYVVTVTPVGGFTGTVALRMTSSSSGPTGVFAPVSLKSGNSALKVNTRRTLGTFTLTITGTSGRLTSSTTVTLTVTT
ncbi:MAG: hypothetical protein JO248_13175, partial [Acidimicrobiia bacterium]|nr:hypothetical protein [Acidimicrobiia bacterium]